jgi:arylsulfatase A-like enzyme/Tfp pilus assembly protein PilF
MGLSKGGHRGRLPGWAAFLLAPFFLYAVHTNSGAAQTEAQSSTPVILISVDTLRADRLGAYGNHKLRTPHIDAVAQGGTLFYQIDAQVPMTLPSHTSLLTSTYPFANGVEENGDHLGSGAVTLATTLRARGYQTAAFIGGYVLARQFGLDQGFDFYDSPFDQPVQSGEDATNLKRPGKDVVQAATQWLQAHSNQPFLVFLHLYDLHLPYALPGSGPGPKGYDAELSYVDEVLGRFWQYLATQGLLDKTLIVFTSDHGESLGEHGEKTHQYFIYESTLWVPLIIHWPAGVPTCQPRVEEPASLLDVAPTILQYLGIPSPPQFQGRSLLDLLSGKVQSPAREVYSESLYARDHLDCSPLRSLRLGQYKYIGAPKPELYDLARDPGEQHNLFTTQNALALSLRERLLTLRSRYSSGLHTGGQAAVDLETLNRLSSLGYLALSHRQVNADDSGIDPKDRIGEYRQYGRAIMLASAGQLPEAIEEFGKVLKDDPGNVLARFYLAVCYFRSRQLDDAVKELQTALAEAPDDVQTHELLGTIWLEKRDYGRAEAEFRHILSIAPDDYGANYNLGVLDLNAGQWEEGVLYLGAAVHFHPSSVQAHTALGEAYLQRGKWDQAQSEFAEALHLAPKSASAHYNLGKVLLQRTQVQEAVEEFRRALVLDPHFQPALQALDTLKKPHD